MDNVDNVVSLDVRRAIKQSGMTMREFANAAHISYETLRGIVYRGRMTSILTAYEMAHIAGELRIPGPHGTAVMRIEDDRTPPPSSPAAIIPLRRRVAA